jgi:FkbM family methyltransferase
MPQPFKTRIRELVTQKPQFGWTLKSGLKVRVSSNSDWTIYNDIFVDGEYDLPIQFALQSTSTDRAMNVLDLGANVGLFTLRFVDLFRRQRGREPPFRVTLLEGSPHIAAELSRRLLDENGLGDWLRIVQGLVGERAGTAKFGEYDFHAINSIFFDSMAKSTEVDFVDLDTLFDQDEIIDLLKCDIEGAELNFVKNYPALLGRTRTAVFELHHDKCDTEMCRTVLRTAGLCDQRLLRKTEAFSVWHFRRT